MSRSLSGAMLALGLAAPGGCASDDAVVLHDSVGLQLLRADNEATSPLESTAAVGVTIHYDGCLAAFYEEHPQWQQGGDQGAAVFDDWSEDLNADITQQLGDMPGLVVVYRESRAVENITTPIGPLPTSELVDCAEPPTVRLLAQDVRGYDDDGEILWEGVSAPVDEAAVGQGLPLKVRVGRS